MSDFSDELPRPVTLDWLGWRFRDLHRRVRSLEQIEAEHDPRVTDLRLRNIERDLQGLKKALYGLMFVIVAASVTFSFTVFSLLGRHP